jgi:hypothetical protein
MKTRYKNIIRCNYRERDMVGYYVRVMYGGRSFQHFFSDSRCGDRLSALSDALRFRHDAERRLGKPRTERIIRKYSKANQGVYLTRHNGRLVYMVTWSPAPYMTLKKQFGIRGNGFRRAKRSAVAFRRKMERTHYR